MKTSANANYQIWEFLCFLLIGVLGGAYGYLYLRTLQYMNIWIGGYNRLRPLIVAFVFTTCTGVLRFSSNTYANQGLIGIFDDGIPKTVS